MHILEIEQVEGELLQNELYCMRLPAVRRSSLKQQLLSVKCAPVQKSLGSIHVLFYNQLKLRHRVSNVCQTDYIQFKQTSVLHWSFQPDVLRTQKYVFVCHMSGWTATIRCWSGCQLVTSNEYNLSSLPENALWRCIHIRQCQIIVCVINTMGCRFLQGLFSVFTIALWL